MAKKPYVPLPVRPDADSSFIQKKIYDIPYASQSEAQKLDLYYPNEGEGPFPTIVYFHGGGFFMRDKKDDQCQLFLNLTCKGFAVASCNYRLTVEAPFPAFLKDASNALRYLKENSDDLKLDPGRFALAGQSAGGYIAAMLAATAESREFSDPESADTDLSVRACIDLFGTVDFSTSADQLRRNGRSGPGLSCAPRPVLALFFGVERLDQVTHEMLDQSNILRYVTSSMPPTLVQHGFRDHLVAVQQSEQLVDCIRERTCDENAVFDILSDADHDDPLFLTEENISRIYRFLKDTVLNP